ncbi:hypothetical protein PENSPDRAFT_683424 [Peniophora sp. CONT]|nr:hypothetical protein PENSPDRAFT_683424 [Peniophora sp. CONT]
MSTEITESVDVDDRLLKDRLYPTIPCRTTRYDRKDYPAKPPGDLFVQSHYCPAPAYSSGDEWQPYTHPEGKGYWIKRIDALLIITELNMKDPVNKDAANTWAVDIIRLAEEQDIKLGRFNELWIMPELDTNICDYYFVDHNSRAVFWLESLSCSAVGLPPACSEQHMKLVLEENYWKHIEMFCMHLSSGLPGDPLTELIGIYIHARGDLATSSTSTFVFSPEVTDVHLDLLMRCQATPYNPAIYAFVGRLWGYVANYRFQNHHGEDHCRLDRTTSVFGHAKDRPSMVSRFISAFMFGQPVALHHQLNEQVVDGMMIECVWSAFIRNLVAEWQKLTKWTFAVIVASAMATGASPIPVVTYTSFVLSATSLLVAILLQYHLQDLGKNDVDDALDFLTAQNGKMMPLAITMSLPRAAFIWSLILFAVQAVVILFFSVPLLVGIAVCVILLALTACISWTLFPAHRLSLSIPSFTLPRLRILSFPSRLWGCLYSSHRRFHDPTSMLPQLHLPFRRSYEKIPDAERCD